LNPIPSAIVTTFLIIGSRYIFVKFILINGRVQEKLTQTSFLL
jgi:hypothetical protein